MSQLTEIKVPDIGDFSDVPIIEIYVKPGDTVALDDALVTLESDKATMDVPATAAGVVREVLVKLGDRVSEGRPLIRVALDSRLRGNDGESCRNDERNCGNDGEQTLSKSSCDEGKSAIPAVSSVIQAASPVIPVIPAKAGIQNSATQTEGVLTSFLPPDSKIHASPSVRAYARELGADLSRVTPSGPNGRVLKEDVTAWIKGTLTATARTGATGSGLDLLPWPKIDFAKFGDIEVRPLSRIQKISGQNLARNWVMIPAVTYHEDADITELEAFRVQINNEKTGNAKLTLLAFLIKASVRALQQFPAFNSSLDGDNLILKKYFHIGFAADTPNGLMVPVIKNADRKGIFEIAFETGELARQAREGTLKPGDMQGAGFTVSSLGGIGGTAFSPIINAPEVAILGVNKSALKPMWDGKAFQPRLTLPLSLTADHRVIDGALATRFNVCLAQLLADFRRVAL